MICSHQQQSEFMETEASVAEVELVCPTRNRALGRCSGSPRHLGGQQEDSCSPTVRSIRIIPLAVVYLACRIDFKLFPVYSQSHQVVSL